MTIMVNAAVLVPASVEVVKRFSGHSGCSTLLCRSGDHYFVRKVSASPEYNPRLSRQIEKQAKASIFAPTPKVLGVGQVDGLTYFDMEFVAGNDILNFLPANSISSIPALVQRIFDAMNDLARMGDGQIEPFLFERKVESVYEAIRGSGFYEGARPQIDRAVATLRLADWAGIPRTECHGDFTLENILVRPDGSIVMIDLLDGELESGWLDVAKLLFDLDCGWSFRASLWKKDLSSHDRLLLLLAQHLKQELEGLALNRFEGIGTHLVHLKMLQAIRVLPYVRSQAAFDRVVSLVDTFNQQANA